MVVKGSSDKFIYVTGCDTGFGAILTEQLDNLGFSVLSGVYTQEGFDKIKKERSSNVRPIKVDVSDEKSVENCGKEITRIITDVGGTLHGVVNNAGILVQPGPTEWTPNEAYRQMFNVNIMGTVMTTKSLLPLLRKSQGRILNVASIAGRVGLPTEPAYCMSKYGVEGYSEVLRKDMLVWGVTVHIIEPGVFKNTGLYGRFQTGLDKLWENLSPELKKEYGEAHYKDIRESMGTALYNGNSRSEMVVEAMVHALTADKPKYRYKVGNDSKYILSILEKCHEATQDKLLAPAKGVKPVGAPANGRQVAEGRYEKNWPRFILIVLIIAFLLHKARM